MHVIFAVLGQRSRAIPQILIVVKKHVYGDGGLETEFGTDDFRVSNPPGPVGFLGRKLIPRVSFLTPV